MFSSSEKKSWYSSGKYVLNPEGLTIQMWYIFSNTCFFFAIHNICSHLAFDLQTVTAEPYFEVFFDIIFLIDIILTFFTAAEIHDKEYQTEEDEMS